MATADLPMESDDNMDSTEAESQAYLKPPPTRRKVVPPIIYHNPSSLDPTTKPNIYQPTNAWTTPRNWSKRTPRTARNQSQAQPNPRTANPSPSLAPQPTTTTTNTNPAKIFQKPKPDTTLTSNKVTQLNMTALKNRLDRRITALEQGQKSIKTRITSLESIVQSMIQDNQKSWEDNQKSWEK